MSGIDCNSDSDAAINLSRVLYFFARILAFFSPIPLIPIAYSNFSNETFLEFSMVSKRLLTLLSPNPSNSINSSFLSFKL